MGCACRGAWGARRGPPAAYEHFITITVNIAANIIATIIVAIIVALTRTIGATATGAGQQTLQEHPRFATLDNPPPSSPPDDNPPPSPPSRDR